MRNWLDRLDEGDETIAALIDAPEALSILFRRPVSQDGDFQPVWVSQSFQFLSGFTISDLKMLKSEFLSFEKQGGAEIKLSGIMDPPSPFSHRVTIYARVRGPVSAQITLSAVREEKSGFDYRIIKFNQPEDIKSRPNGGVSPLGLGEVESAEISEKQLRAALKNANLAVWEWNVLSNDVRYSPECYTMLGFKPEEFPSEFAPWADRMYDDHREECRAVAFSAINGGADFYEIQFKMRCKDNSWKWIRSNGTILERDPESGMAIRVSGTQLDITKDIEREEALKRALEKAEQARKAKEQFLAVMSHEIRTPIHGILGMLEFALETQLTEEQFDYVNTAFNSSKNLLSILNDTLDYSKLETGASEVEEVDFNIHDSVRSALALFSAEAQQKDIALIADISPDVPAWMRGDSAKIRQILVNLLGNALKFTEAGKISVALAVDPDVKTYNRVYITVTDSGVGIPKSAHKSIFNSFTQADASTARRYGGTGLGLAITKKLTDLLGGTIALNSEEGVGTTFIISLPLKRAAQCPPDQETSSEPILFKTQYSGILVVEDNPINVKIAQRFLQSYGLTAEVCEDGIQALGRTLRKKYDLILMDIQMPVLDGIETASRIRKGDGPNKNTPIVALTADAIAGDQDRYKEAGMNGYITKPINRALFVEELGRYLSVRS